MHLACTERPPSIRRRGLLASMKASDQQRLQRLERYAELLDESIRIPIIGYRIGYDALIGLIPGIGDAAGLLAGAYVILEAARFNLPRSTLLRMIANVVIETLIGTIPIIGDVFDATYKANLRNLRLLHERLEAPERLHRPEDRRFFALLILLPALLITALLAGFVLLFIALL